MSRFMRNIQLDIITLPGETKSGEVLNVFFEIQFPLVNIWRK